MLLEFRVSNFRSFRDEAVLSFAASDDESQQASHTRETGLEKVKRVLNAVAIYGANASGKSNLIRAMHFMQLMVATSNQVAPDQENALTPFLMRPNHETHPTRFEATFIIDGKRHQYGFEMTRKQILEEWLLVYERAKPQVWFSRTFNKESGKYDYSYSNYFLGRKKIWELSTRKEVLFLTTAVQLNNEQLKKLFQCLTEEMAVFPLGMGIDFSFSSTFSQDEKSKERVVSFMAAADTGISSVSFQKKPARQLRFDVNTGGIPELRETELNIPFFGHRDADGRVYNFEYGDESAGTQIFFSMAGPLIDILQKGRLLVVDELDKSLHPLLVQKIVGMFNDPDLNRLGAQIVFTTHDVSLMDSRKMRRDQIWFTEKDNDQKSHLFPLLDFSPRKGEALEKGYLGGRYGGVPILGSTEE